MSLRHYYHVYAVGDWQTPVEEHLTAMNESGLSVALGDNGFRVGIVGTPDESERVREFCLDRVPSTQIMRTCFEGWEQATLSYLRVWEHLQPHDGAVLYAHTKGVHDPSEINVAWRRSMEQVVVRGWRECLADLWTADAVGCHWLTAQEYPGQVDIPYFGGNWWWAKARYLRTLEEPRYINRWFGEAWLGSGNPSVVDRLPGWPDVSLFLS